MRGSVWIAGILSVTAIYLEGVQGLESTPAAVFSRPEMRICILQESLNRNEFCRRAALIAGGQKLPSPIALSKPWVTGESAYAQKLPPPTTVRTWQLLHVNFAVERATRLPWAHNPRLQQLSPLLLTTNNFNKSGHLFFPQN
jgi:hypothetical protein